MQLSQSKRWALACETQGEQAKGLSTPTHFGYILQTWSRYHAESVTFPRTLQNGTRSDLGAEMYHPPVLLISKLAKNGKYFTGKQMSTFPRVLSAAPICQLCHSESTSPSLDPGDITGRSLLSQVSASACSLVLSGDVRAA